MRQFKVKAPIQLSNKRVAEFGVIVSEKQLHDNADELLQRGFIEVFEVDKNADSIDVNLTTKLPSQTEESQSAPKAPKAKKAPKTPKK